MDWTTVPPTKPGHYWWRRNKYKAEAMYYVFSRDDVMLCRRSLDVPCDPEPLMADGEWYGPLKPPQTP